VTEPRLSGFDVWHSCTNAASPDGIVGRTVCAPPTVPVDLVSMVSDGCDRPMRTMTDAVRVLAYVPDCTDAAIAKLELLAETGRQAELLSNLSAGYYIRAQRKDQPSDFARALDAADEAVTASPIPAAQFNRALAEEALGLTSDAISSWDSARGGTDGWAKEAADHLRRLRKQQTVAAATQWRFNEQRLPEVARRGDRKGVEALITPYRAAAQRYVEDTVLVAWAAARAKGDDAGAAEQLQLAEMIADALARLTRDRYLQDVVQPIRRSDAVTDAAFRRGIAAYAAGRTEERTLRNEVATADAYARAEHAFGESRNPFQLMAMIKRAAALMLGGRFDEAQRTLSAADAEARRAGYSCILGRIHTGLGFAGMLQGRLLDSVAEYADAEDQFRRTGDVETLCNVLTRNIGVYRLIGNHDLTWREIFKTRNYASAMLDPQARHIFLGEIAAAALDLGCPHAALRFQNEAVALLHDELRRNANDDKAVAQLISNLSVALRARAAIYAHLGDDKAAQRDLDEALSRISAGLQAPDAAIQNGFRARLAEVEAQTLAKQNRRQEAIAALTRGIDSASRTHFSSLIASLLVQRADQESLAGNRTAELEDLRAALVALRREEQAMLGGKRPQHNAEQMWSSYFGRYQETYRRLIQRLVERGEDAEAFGYAEKARAFEPLHLILTRGDVPPSFRARIRDDEPFDMGRVKESLPVGTFLLQYAVTDEQTFVWVIWKGDFQRTTLPVGNARIAQWTSKLQRLGRSSDYEEFDRALAEPYAELLSEPLARVAKLNAGRGAPHVVVVPDRAMHGLPFAALRNGNRYVVQDYVISVAASATLYAYSLAKDRQNAGAAPASMLVIADPAFDKHMEVARDLRRLEWARAEGRDIEQLYKDVVSVKTLEGPDATPAAFFRDARESSIIHVAAHGIANSDIPSRSFLLFARSADDSGAVDAERLITQLRLTRARLVVLSTCSSAGGTPVGPEGLAPLVRPLLVAGVPGVIGTLWNVKENSETAELLVRFHRHYRNGADADDALRQAQLEMLGDPELERNSAVAWSPFQAIGHASSPFKQDIRR
jgi:CHAT domain-containing protein